MAAKKTIYRTSKVKTFLFFLLLATIFWLLTKFSKNSSATVFANLSYTNIPSEVSLSDKNTEEISFSIAGNGFEMLSYRLREPTIVIDLSKYYEKGDSLLLLSSSEIANLISQQLKSKANITNISKDELWISLDAVVGRKVAVELLKEVTFREGYNTIEPLTIYPDSVMIIGPSEIISEINNLRTKRYVNSSISEDISEDIDIDISALEGVSIQPEKVLLTAKVSEFSQKEILVPVELRNVPDGLDLKLLPESILVTFNVSVLQFNSIYPSDFKVVCDYALKAVDEDFLIPRIERQPNGLHHVELATKRVEYLIFK